MSLWIRLCNHTYIHTYTQRHRSRPAHGKAQRGAPQGCYLTSSGQNKRNKDKRSLLGERSGRIICLPKSLHALSNAWCSSSHGLTPATLRMISRM